MKPLVKIEDLNPELQKGNEAKYGNKQNDVIAQAFKRSKYAGDVYAGYNAIKYITRYIGDSHKAENIVDLHKVQDYIARMIEQQPTDVELHQPFEVVANGQVLYSIKGKKETDIEVGIFCINLIELYIDQTPLPYTKSNLHEVQQLVSAMIFANENKVNNQEVIE